MALFTTGSRLLLLPPQQNLKGHKRRARSSCLFLPQQFAPRSIVALLIVVSCATLGWQSSSSTLSSTNQHEILVSSRKEVTIEKVKVDFSAACLLVMDDNHFLIEWLAYHYHVARLRRLIVTVDPRSRTSPSPIFDRWKDSALEIVVWWKDADFAPNATEWDEAETWVSKRFAKDKPSLALVRHRARQRLFYYHCMQEHKRNGMEYTLLTDVDEFVSVNHESVKALRAGLDESALSISQAGSVLTLLQNERSFHLDDNTTSCPCVQIPRLRFGAVETNRLVTGGSLPSLGLNTSHFATMRWRVHADALNYPMNRISKVIVDVSRVEEHFLTPVSSIHRPVEHYCKKRRLHIRTTEQRLVIHHYLGTWEQYSFRDDSRAGNERSRQVRRVRACDGKFIVCGFHSSCILVSRLMLYVSLLFLWVQMYDKAASLNESIRDVAAPWLQGFVDDVGGDKARHLLRDVGVVVPPSDEE
jgi:hypothetical protein